MVRTICLYLVLTWSAGCDATDDANIAILILLYLELRANFRTLHWISNSRWNNSAITVQPRKNNLDVNQLKALIRYLSPLPGLKQSEFKESYCSDSGKFHGVTLTHAHTNKKEEVDSHQIELIQSTRIYILERFQSLKTNEVLYAANMLVDIRSWPTKGENGLENLLKNFYQILSDAGCDVSKQCMNWLISKWLLVDYSTVNMKSFAM